MWKITKSSGQEPLTEFARQLALDCLGVIIASRLTSISYHQMFNHLSCNPSKDDQRLVEAITHPGFLREAHIFLFQTATEEHRLLGLSIYNSRRQSLGLPLATLPPKDSMILNQKHLWATFFGLYRSWLQREFPEKTEELLKPYLKTT